MKYLIVIFFTCSLLSCSDKHKSCSKNKSINLDGWWSDSVSISFSNCYADFDIVGDSVYMTHFIEFNGQPFFETGKGIIKKDSIIYNVIVRHGIEGWSTAGTHKLKLIDNNTLEGTYADNKGNKGPLVFRRR